MSTVVSFRTRAPIAVTDRLQKDGTAFRRVGPGSFMLWSFSMIMAGMRAIRRWRLERGIVATLERLDDRTLYDIGVCRSEIQYVARTQASIARWA
jgi:uncharacterized protein YjiS (DUF1127 family)